jgi:hypothetical protein
MRKKRKKKKYRERRWFTASELVEAWDRWKRGETTKQIRRALDREGTSIHHQLAACGVIRPGSRSRSLRVLTLREREEISRDGSYDNYRASIADQAWERTRRPKVCRLRQCPRLRELV